MSNAGDEPVIEAGQEEEQPELTQERSGLAADADAAAADDVASAPAVEVPGLP
jgi:hypothetical protein